AGTDAPSNRATVESLRTIIRGELTSDIEQLTQAAPLDQPTSETGELGFQDHYDRYHLTVTVGFSAAAYEKLDIDPGNRPQDLADIPWSQLGDAPDQPENGDIVVQVCGDSVYILEHVLRRIEHGLAGQLSLLWTQAGAQRHTSRAGRTSRREGRALIGF